MTHPRPRKWKSSNVLDRLEVARERKRIRMEQDPAKRRMLEAVITRKLIDPSMLGREIELDQTRWMEYGYMSPLERTEHFCALYLKAYVQHCEKYTGKAAAEVLKPIDPELLKNDGSEISALWRARQTVDALGIGYETYFVALSEWVFRQGKRKHFPRPNQLYHEDILMEASTYWCQVRGDSVLPFGEAWDDRFFRQNPRFDRPRNEAIVFMMSRYKNKPQNADIALASLMGARDAIDERTARHLAKKIFPTQPDVVDEALKRVMSPIKERTGTSFDPYMPACLGLSEDRTHQACGSCSFFDACRSMRQQGDGLLIEQLGTNDPRAAKKRTDARNRQRRKRELARQNKANATSGSKFEAGISAQTAG